MSEILEEAVNQLKSFEELNRKIAKLRRKIRQVEVELARERPRIVILDNGTVSHNILDDEMKKEARRKIIERCKSEIAKLEIQKKSLLSEMTETCLTLSKEYEKQFVKINILWRQFIKDLATLRKTWTKLENCGLFFPSAHRVFCDLKRALGENVNGVKSVPPYSKFGEYLKRVFTMLDNYLEEERYEKRV